jgi:hypothetical protein
MFELLDWIDINKIDWATLSKNLNAISLLEKNKNKNKINWCSLSENPNSIKILKKTKTK